MLLRCQWSSWINGMWVRQDCSGWGDTVFQLIDYHRRRCVHLFQHERQTNWYSDDGSNCHQGVLRMYDPSTLNIHSYSSVARRLSDRDSASPLSKILFRDGEVVLLPAWDDALKTILSGVAFYLGLTGGPSMCVFNLISLMQYSNVFCQPCLVSRPSGMGALTLSSTN
jgi:hypothetical protein